MNTTFRNLPIIAVVIAVVAAASYSRGITAADEERAHMVPPPSTDSTQGTGSSSVAVFAGGCFWGVQGVFQHVKGVTSAVSGYAGGDKRLARYEIVGEGTSGHAESVQVTFDPRQISYGGLLQIFFSVAHDPTQVNRQGPDYGTQYRSAIFPVDGDQAAVAKAYIEQLNQAHAFKHSIATKIEMGKTFYPAEAYHQDFLTQHPTYPYIVVNDLPKIQALNALFPDIYRDQPTLVADMAQAK